MVSLCILMSSSDSGDEFSDEFSDGEGGEELLDICMDSDDLDEALGLREPSKGGGTGPGVKEPSTSQQKEDSNGKKRPRVEDGIVRKVLKRKVLSEEEMRRLNDKAERRGVVYISRIPPHMKPAKIRQLLSPHGELGRLYCAPEDPSLRRERKRKGKDTGKNFTEGWVEFEDKAVAKQVAARLNGQQIGGKKRGAYYSDLWCLKYLSKFKWDHLTEEINYQRAMREQKLAVEVSASKRERDFYLSKVDRAKAIEAIRERKGGKARVSKVDGDGEGGGGANEENKGVGERGRQFKQRREKGQINVEAPSMPSDVLRLIRP